VFLCVLLSGLWEAVLTFLRSIRLFIFIFRSSIVGVLLPACWIACVSLFDFGSTGAFLAFCLLAS